MENSKFECPQPNRDHYEPIKPQVSRRQLLKVAAAGFTALGLSVQAEMAMAASKRVKAGKASAIPVRGVKGFTLSGQYIIITQPKKGVFKAFSGTCTHQGVKMSSVQGSDVVCSAHGSKFSAATGKVTSGPAMTGLKTYKVAVSKGVLYVTV